MYDVCVIMRRDFRVVPLPCNKMTVPYTLFLSQVLHHHIGFVDAETSILQEGNSDSTSESTSEDGEERCLDGSCGSGEWDGGG